MKLLLTSSGLENQSIINALSDLIQKPFSDSNIAFIPTASNLESGDKKDWLIKDLEDLKKLKFKSIDIVDISALPKEIWLDRLKQADIFFVEGGNTYHLMHWFKKSGLSDVLTELLKNRIYVGVSAGSMIVGPSIENDDSYIGEKEMFKKINEPFIKNGLSLIDFMIEPHINSQYFPEINFKNLEKNSTQYKYPIYGIDDNTAIKIDGDKLEIVSEGTWKLFKK